MPAAVAQQPLPREVRVEHQRERVLAAATEVFAKRGYPATTVDHLVAAAKIGVGNFYTLFSGKEDCLLQAYDRILDAGRKGIVAATPAGRPWPEQACSGLQVLLQVIAERPLEARLALVEVQTAGPAALARLNATLDEVTPFMQAGRAASPLAAELPATLETAIVGGVLWVLQQRVIMGEIDVSEALLPELTKIVVEPYFGEAETQRSLAAVAPPAALG